MPNPIHYDSTFDEYYIWLSRVGIKYMKYFHTAESALEFVKRNPRACMELSKGEVASDEWVAETRTAVEMEEATAYMRTATTSSTEGATLIKQLQFWALLIFGSILVALYTSWLRGDLGGDLLVYVVPSIAGQTTGAVLIPAILVGGIVLIRKLFKRSTSDITIFVVAGVFWIIVVFLNIYAASYEAAMSRSSSMGIGTNRITQVEMLGLDFESGSPARGVVVCGAYVLTRHLSRLASAPLYPAA